MYNIKTPNRIWCAYETNKINETIHNELTKYNKLFALYSSSYKAFVLSNYNVSHYIPSETPERKASTA